MTNSAGLSSAARCKTLVTMSSRAPARRHRSSRSFQTTRELGDPTAYGSPRERDWWDPAVLSPGWVVLPPVAGALATIASAVVVWVNAMFLWPLDLGRR